MKISDLLNLLGVFALLSILAIGGGTAVLPEMKHLTVDVHQWLSDDQFVAIYSLGQLAPGPNMLMVIVIGYHVAGYTGALVAFLAFFVPACVITFIVARVWDHFDGNPWRTAIQQGMAPLVVGLMASGTIAIAKTAMSGIEAFVLAAAVFCALYFGKKINPALLILGGGAVGWFLWH